MRTFGITLRTIGVIGSVAVLLLSATVVLAKGEPEDNTRKGTNVSRENQLDARRGMIASTTQKKVEKIKETARERMEDAREKTQERMETQRKKTEQRVADIKDKVKQETAQRLAKQFENINATWTDHFMQQLERYSVIVQKIQDRADIARTNGREVTATTAAIQSAKDVIEVAQTAVTAQAAKTYTLDTSTIVLTVATTTSSGQEKLIKSLRTAFQGLHTTLFKDLFALRDGPMKDVRKAVQNAIQTLSNIPRVDDDNNDNDDNDDDDERNATSTAENSD